MNISNTDLHNYIHTFIQRHPRYAVKQKNGHWRTKNKPLSDRPIKAHLAGQYYVGVVGKWYPSFAVLDFDDWKREDVERIRDTLRLDDTNSMLCASESPDSYHNLIRPEYRGRPPTLRLFNDAFSNFVRVHGLETYPKRRKVIRLPFGAGQDCLDPLYASLDTWEDKLYRFEKLDAFNLSSIPMRQLDFDFEVRTEPLNTDRFSTFDEGRELYQYGLQYPASRHHSQFKVLYYLWRLNTDQADAERVVWIWIKKNHNGYSKEIHRDPNAVKKDIESQASWLYSKYEHANVYPDETHNGFHGYITEPDLRDIIRLTGGSLPKMKFLFHLIKYANPRRHRLFIDIHRNLYVEWASKDSYMKRLNESASNGILRRYDSYLVGHCSKSIKINWPWRTSSDAVLSNGRSIDTLKSTLRTLYKADELRQLLVSAGVNRKAVYDVIEAVFEL